MSLAFIHHAPLRRKLASYVILLLLVLCCADADADAAI
jgi:hypothetical protein